MKYFTHIIMRIVKSLVAKYENISKEISDIMGGKILEYEAKTIHRLLEYEFRQDSDETTFARDDTNPLDCDA